MERRNLLAEQFEDHEKQANAARFGMWIFLGSESLLFAGLFALYGAYRALYPADFVRAAGHNNIVIGTANTAILITSSLTVALGVHAARSGRLRRTALLYGVSILFGLMFFGLKATEYAEHFRQGIFPGSAYHFAELSSFGARTFFTIYFLTTGLHALHVVAGLILLGWVAFGCLRGVYSAEHHTPVVLGGLYWHLVDVIWIFLWPLLYLSHA